MQPHSMAAVMAANYFWNYHHTKVIMDGYVRVEYQDRWGKYQSKFYHYRILWESLDRRELRIEIEREGSCIVSVRRKSPEVGTEYELIHSIQHASGLREIMDVYSSSISGRHQNSILYGPISANIIHSRQATFRNKIRKADDPETFVTINYTVKLEIPS